MLLLPGKNPFPNDETIQLLEKEIALTEAQLLELETAVNAFQLQIRSALAAHISQIQQLTNLYKAQKQAKKLKRQEQKKRGKNYREPVGLKIYNASFMAQKFVSADEKQELKRLFKEAIVQIHPDKFTDADDELNQRATAVTAQLNEVYQNGNLDEMSRLHEYIISGNALTYVPDQPQTIKNSTAMVEFLQDKKRKLLLLIDEIITSEIYNLLKGSKNLPTLIEELRLAFEQRITVLEKRTK